MGQSNEMLARVLDIVGDEMSKRSAKNLDDAKATRGDDHTADHLAAISGSLREVTEAMKAAARRIRAFPAGSTD